ncbi:hypothetical protein ACVI9W_000629 [Pseudomonas sp. 210_17 TE3656]
MNIKPMEQQLRSEVLRRLQDQYGLKPRAGTQYLRQGTCPSCGKKELYSRQDEPWFIKCGRESKCGEQWHVKELFDELFDDYSKRYPTTQEAPRASADAYLQFARGFDLGLVKGWYTQENYWDRDLNIGSATVRFALEKGGYWERLIDQPHRFGKEKHHAQRRQRRAISPQPTRSVSHAAGQWFDPGTAGGSRLRRP